MFTATIYLIYLSYANFLALTQMAITYQNANSVVKQFLTEHHSELKSFETFLRWKCKSNTIFLCNVVSKILLPQQ